MRKKREYIICDRCKKEIEKINVVYDNQYSYELCDKCFECFEEYKDEKMDLLLSIKRLEEKYQFGVYLPKNEGDDK